MLSIITPVFNGAKTLEACITSILALKDSRIEHIVIDGGSEDDTPDILKHYASRIGPVISEPDNGVYEAMNKGIHLASGNWLLFIGADDFILKPVSDAIDHLQHPEHIYYANVFYPNSARIFRGKTSTYRLMLDNLSHQCIFYPKAVFERYQYDTRYPIMADYVLNMQCHADETLKFQYLPYVVAIHSDHDGLSKTSKDAAFIHDKPELIKTFFGPYWFSAYAAHKGMSNFMQRIGLRDKLITLLKWNS